jgi:hypothetical protein
MSKEFKPTEVALKARQFHLLNQFVSQPLFDFSQQGITYWEELGCVGFNPAQSRLEAIIQVKQTTGYSGGLCTNGSSEYVRFFVDYGSGYQDAGLDSFKAYDIADPSNNAHPLHYMVAVNLKDELYRKLCSTPVMPKVKAILSWNSIPTNDPNQPIVYGNAREVNIQLKPKQWKIIDIFEVNKIALESVSIKHLDLDQFIPQQVKKPIPIEELQRVYLKEQVPQHRMLFNLIYPSIKPVKASVPTFNFNPSEFSKEFNIDWLKLTDILLQPTTNTDYEELTCVGLNSAKDTLGAVIHVKRPNGFSGTLCYQGSVEYVAFWADWNNDGSYDEYLGTSKVEVHDISTMPAGGLYYCVSLPLSIANRLKFCSAPNVAGIRGVLSWNIEPSTTDPNDLHYYGNRLDVKVQIRKKEYFGSDINFHYHDIGQVPLAQISNSFAYYSPAGSSYSNRPWGGNVHVGGRFENSGPAGNVHYRVEWCITNSPTDADWAPVATSQRFYLYNPISGFYDSIVDQTTTDGWFSYLEDFNAGNLIDEYDATLSNWNTTGKQGNYFIRVIYTTDHSHSSFIRTTPVLIRINNIRYNPNTAFHNYIPGMATLSSAHDVDMIFDGAGGCISNSIGQVFNGHFKSVHQYFAKTHLYVMPANSQAVLSSGPVTTAASATLVRESTVPGFTGYSNEAWSMNTASMQRCGYVLVMDAFERTIYNGDHNLPYATVSIGFAII